jgi:tetratricopeptide (TPR) repeat protein
VKLTEESALNPRAAGRLAAVLERAQRHEQALKLYVVAARGGPQGGNKPLVKGFALAARIGKPDVLAELVSLLRRNYPRECAVRLRVATLALQSYGRYQGATRRKLLKAAEDLFAEAAGLARSPGHRSQALYGLGRTQSFAGKLSEAAGSYGRAAEALLAGGGQFRARWAEWQFERAVLLVKLGRKEEARKVLGRIVADAGKTPAGSRAERELQRLKPGADAAKGTKAR